MIAALPAAEAIARLAGFDAVIDARTEAEFAEDHVPGALNWPSLSNAERVEVGSLYKQVSPFAARKRGAVLVARNIARHVERELGDTPYHWKPLVYCWRGGKRSGALATVLREIGFSVALLDGGYREFRRAVLSALDTLAPALALRVVCGPTGSGKSLLLARLAALGAQVLDLEALAEHRGSVLGLVPGGQQPSQKRFDTRLWDALRRLDAGRPVFVESESRRIGAVRLPTALLEHMRSAPCIALELPRAARVELLMREYAHFVSDVPAFCARLDALRVLRGHERVNAWQEMARSGDLRRVVDELLEHHYDPGYLASLRRNFAGLGAGAQRVGWDGDAASLDAAALQLCA